MASSGSFAARVREEGAALEAGAAPAAPADAPAGSHDGAGRARGRGGRD